MSLVTKIVVIGLIVILIFDLLQQLQIKKASQSLNLIIISIDDLRPDHVGAYGYSKNTTPNIDNWSKAAFIFTNAITKVPWTYPSFVSLLTGQSQQKNRIINISDMVNDNTPTLAKILKTVGYNNYAFLTNPNLNSDLTGLNRGFDYYTTLSEPQTNRSRYENFINNAIAYIVANKNKKMFAWIHLIDPHSPYYPPEKFRCTFNDSYCAEISSKSFTQLEQDRYALSGCNVNNSGKDKGLYETLYDGDIAYTDRLVGNILGQLKNAQLDKNSIVVLLSDHGEGFDHNYYFDHGGVLYDSSLKIMFMLKDPLIRSSGVKVNSLITNGDFVPTILDLLNISKKNIYFDGNSFSPHITQGILPELIYYFSHPKPLAFVQNHSLTKFGVYNDRYKYIYSAANDCLYNNQVDELYDLKNDPQELVNIYTKNRILGDSLKSELFKYLSQYNLPSKIFFQPKNSEVIENSSSLNNKEKQQLLENLKSLGY